MTEGFHPPPLWLSTECEWDLRLPLHRVSYLLMLLNSHEWPVFRRYLMVLLGIKDAAKTDDSEEEEEEEEREKANEEAVDALEAALNKVRNRRRILKGLAMELLSGSSLRHLDQPSQVTANCEVKKGRPNRVAGAGECDITADFPNDGQSPAFRIVAEVSAKEEMEDKDVEDQLAQALEHANTLLEEDPERRRIYCLVVNNGKIFGTRDLQRRYRKFAEANSLTADGPIRMVPLHALDFGMIIGSMTTQLDSTYFKSSVLSNALDTVCEAILDPEPPNERLWMIETFINAVRASLGEHTSGLGDEFDEDAEDDTPAAPNM